MQSKLLYLLMILSISMLWSLNLTAQTTTVEDFESGDFSQMNWQFSGTPNSWFVEQTEDANGNITYAATARHIAFNDYVTISITKTFTAPGQVSFDLKQTADNFLIYEVVNVDGMYWYSEDDEWQTLTMDVPAGTQTISFTSYNVGIVGEPFTMRDSLFIDNIVFPNQISSEVAYVQVVHNSADPIAAQVDVYLGDELILDDFAFRTATPYVELPAGVVIDLHIKAANSIASDPSLFTKSVQLEQGETYQLIASGIVGDPDLFDPFVPFDIGVYPQARQSAQNSTLTDVLVYHGATDAPVVDIQANGQVLVDNISYGSFEGYYELTPENYKLTVTNENGNTSVASYYLPLLDSGYAGQAATVVASGFLNPESNNNGSVFGLYVVPVAGGELLSLSLITENLEGAVEDFETNDFSLLNWTFYGTPNAWHIVADEETGTLAATAKHQDFNEHQTMKVFGEFTQEGALIVDLKQTSDASVLIIETGNDGLYAIDFDNQGWYTVALPIVPGYHEISFTSYIMGVYGEIFESQTDSVLIDKIRFSTTPDPVANVQFINNMADYQFANLDIWYNGELAMNDMYFGSTSQFVEMPANTSSTFAITESNSTQPLLTRSFVFDPNKTYILVLEGFVNDNGYNPFIPADIYVFETSLPQTPADKVGVVFHNGISDSPAVTLVETNMGNRALEQSMSFGEFSAYQELAILDYFYEVRDETTNDLLAQFPLNLTGMDVAGQTITVMLTGFMNPEQNNNGAPMAVMYTTEAGGSMNGVDDITNVSDLKETQLNVYPNPARDLLTIETSADLSNAQMEIYSSAGMLIRTERIGSNLTSSAGKLNIDVSNVPSGVYVLKISNAAFQKTVKLQIIK